MTTLIDDRQQLKADLRAKIGDHLIEFIDSFGGCAMGFPSEIEVNEGNDGEPEVCIAINGRRRTVSYSFLVTTLKVF
ncbi:hypothetical protein ACFOTA_12325 [Chitinophaga sp. GCM10012297]|uniref:Uncharacterized protein n=1 Tax=Chitinophaga chungangae TaxID=2821488 RepID=A0ABS3YE82_9BACT|nr:hypothetical protein [Chitinophaga chungangae]MBO9152997.1 hypothetical protein [Chitinophaga chungangae]